MNLLNKFIQNPKSKLSYIQSNASSLPYHERKIRYSIGRDEVIHHKIKKPLSKTNIQIKGIEFDMILCPTGYFDMGGGDDVSGASIPTSRRYVSKPFLLSETEVTIELYEAIMGFNPSVDKKILDKPVNQVTWYDAILFCNRLSQAKNLKPYYQISNTKHFDLTKKETVLQIQEAQVQIDPSASGYRLPTSKEWEYAAKAGTNNKYAGYNHIKDADLFAWFYENSEMSLHSVKQKRSNEWGFYDMSGNVYEWCEDRKVSFNTRRERTVSGILRGGCYQSDEEFGLLITGLSHDSLNLYSSKIGFRIARYA